MHKTAAEIVNLTVANSLRPFLTGLGFRSGPGRSFLRKVPGGITQRIVFQLVRAREDPEQHMHFGIGFEALRPIEARWKSISPAEASNSQLGDSVGHVSPPFRFRSLPVVNADQLAEACLDELTNNVLPFLVRHSDLSTAVECWDGDYPYGRVNARIFGPLGRLALGDVAGGIASAYLHQRRLESMGADADVIDEQKRLAAFIRDYRPVEDVRS